MTEIILETHGLTKITLALDPKMMLLNGRLIDARDCHVERH